MPPRGLFLFVVNGSLDANETTNAILTGITVRLYLDANNDNVADGAAIATTTTTAGGAYSFTNLSAARYIVGVVQPSGWHSTIDTSSQTDNDNPVNGVDNNDNGHGTSYGEVQSRSYNLVAGSSGGNNVVTASTGTTSNDRLDFGMSQSPTAAEFGVVRAVRNDDNTVTITWETLNETTILGFNVQRGETAVGEFSNLNSDVIPALSVGSNTGNTYEFIDTTVSGKGTYYYRIQVTRADATTFESETIDVKLKGTNGCGKLDAPVLLTPERDAKVKNGKVEFTWQVLDCAKTYRLELRADSPDGEQVASKTIKNGSFSIKKLDAGRTYYWRVSACNAKAKCVSSEWVAFQMKRDNKKK